MNREKKTVIDAFCTVCLDWVFFYPGQVSRDLNFFSGEPAQTVEEPAMWCGQPQDPSAVDIIFIYKQMMLINMHYTQETLAPSARSSARWTNLALTFCEETPKVDTIV